MTTTIFSWGSTNKNLTSTVTTTERLSTTFTSNKKHYTNDVRAITAIFSVLTVISLYLLFSLLIFCRRVKFVQEKVCKKNSSAKERLELYFSNHNRTKTCFILSTHICKKLT